MKRGMNMIKDLQIIRYRKLENLTIKLSNDVNVISGTNGTCKTSLLYLISNSFQKVKKTNPILKDSNCIDIINNLNNSLNPKLETLTKGDKKYNDPAYGVSGKLYTANYLNDDKIEFRRHNTNNRFSVKPSYKKGCAEKLPEIPVIYLGLSRLCSYGEYQVDDHFTEVKKKMPEKYSNIINKKYEEFTGHNVSYSGHQKMGNLKVRSEFFTEKDGIDSNTISAGEDNLYIIINALVSLRYYYESLKSSIRDVESILLIDEIDATLHPSLQIKLLNLLKEYAVHYRIQIVFTTHSLYLLEKALKGKNNVIYLVDYIDSVGIMEDVDIYKIKMHLNSEVKEDIYYNKSIPIFTEDAEARLFLNCIFNYFQKKYKSNFSSIRSLFHLVEANISSTNLIAIFNDSHLLRSTMRSICVLDGDQKNNLNNCIITLPSKENLSPEKLVFQHAWTLFETELDFWQSETVESAGYTKIYFRDNILPDIKNIEMKIEKLKEEKKSTKGVEREQTKDVFNRYKQFFEFVIIDWIHKEENQKEIQKFYCDLKTLFKKVSKFHDINSNEWKD